MTKKNILFRSILYERFVYTLILTTFYNYAPEKVLKFDMDPVENIMIEIQAADLAISDICEAANNAFCGCFMAALTIDPSLAKKLELSKCFFLE